MRKPLLDTKKAAMAAGRFPASGSFFWDDSTKMYDLCLSARMVRKAEHGPAKEIFPAGEGIAGLPPFVRTAVVGYGVEFA